MSFTRILLTQCFQTSQRIAKKHIPEIPGGSTKTLKAATLANCPSSAIVWGSGWSSAHSSHMWKPWTSPAKWQQHRSKRRDLQLDEPCDGATMSWDPLRVWRGSKNHEVANLGSRCIWQMVNVPLKHHPTTGNTISNRYLCFGDVKQIPKKGHQSQPLCIWQI